MAHFFRTTFQAGLNLALVIIDPETNNAWQFSGPTAGNYNAYDPANPGRSALNLTASGTGIYYQAAVPAGFDAAQAVNYTQPIGRDLELWVIDRAGATITDAEFKGTKRETRRVIYTGSIGKYFRDRAPWTNGDLEYIANRITRIRKDISAWLSLIASNDEVLIDDAEGLNSNDPSVVGRIIRQNDEDNRYTSPGYTPPYAWKIAAPVSGGVLVTIPLGVSPSLYDYIDGSGVGTFVVLSEESEMAISDNLQGVPIQVWGYDISNFDENQQAASKILSIQAYTERVLQRTNEIALGIGVFHCKLGFGGTAPFSANYISDMTGAVPRVEALVGAIVVGARGAVWKIYTATDVAGHYGNFNVTIEPVAPGTPAGFVGDGEVGTIRLNTAISESASEIAGAVANSEFFQQLAATEGVNGGQETQVGQVLTQVMNRPDGGTLTRVSSPVGNARVLTVTTVPGEGG